MKWMLCLLCLGSMVFGCKNKEKSMRGVERAPDVNVDPVVVGGGQKSDPVQGPVAAGVGFVGEHGLLRAAGGKLVDQNKKVIQLRGMSLFWSQYAPEFWNKGAVETLRKDWKANLLRAAMGIEDGGYLTNPQVEKDRVKAMVDVAAALDMYVIIDWHDHNLHADKAVEFFGEMARVYKDVPNVMFEVFNEPDYESWDEVKAYAETVIGEIRKQGAKNLVIVGSPTWSQRVDLAADKPIVDENIAYTLHFYAGTHKQDLRDKATYALGKGLTLFVTEFGVCDASGNGNVDLVETDRWMKFMDDNQISWANWALNDKVESASALKNGVSKTGGWSEADLTESGVYVKRKMQQ